MKLFSALHRLHLGSSWAPLRIGVAAAVIMVATGAADAACFADYKAKQDEPLQLHYGVIKVGDGACGSRGGIEREVARRVSGGGWQLLTVVSTFGEAGAQQRRASAGEFYLRY